MIFEFLSANDLDSETGDLQLGPRPIGRQNGDTELDRERHAVLVPEAAARLTCRLRQPGSCEGGLTIVRVQVEAQLLDHLLDHRESHTAKDQGFHQFLEIDGGHGGLICAAGDGRRSCFIPQERDGGGRIEDQRAHVLVSCRSLSSTRRSSSHRFVI